MAASLEELLAEEGFGRRRSNTMARPSFRSEALSRPRYSVGYHHKSGNPSAVKRTERAKSDIPQYDLEAELQPRDRLRARRPRDDLGRREKSERGSKKEVREKHERKGSQDSWGGKVSSIGFSEDLPGCEIIKSAQNNEIVEVGVDEYEGYKDIYSNEVYTHERSHGAYFKGNEERGRRTEVSRKNILVEKRYGNNSNKNLPGYPNLNDNQRKHMNQSETSYNRSKRSSQNNKTFDERKSQRQVVIEQTVFTEPALDVVAVQALVSILCGYVNRFLKDEDFRTSLHHHSFASLSFSGLEEDVSTDSKVIANLDQAIETVERAAEECASAKELKKASFQLSVITGLNSNDLKDGFTSGIPNFKLSACAHLYLSVIYKLQKKDRIAAKHLLQMFCDSPFQARMTLLPELWDYLFLPHLSHLKAWYDKEAGSLADTSTKARKLRLVEKVYNEILDTGTYQFAVYYKDWLTEGIEAPSLPSINIPSISLLGVQQGGLHGHSPYMGSPDAPFSSQPRVSKKLYETVFGRSHNPGVEVEDYEADNFDISVRSSDASAVEEQKTLTYSTETVKQTEQDVEPDGVSDPGNDLMAEQQWQLHAASESTHILHALQRTKENELAIKKLGKSVFELQHTEESVDLIDSILLPHSADAPTIMGPSMGELNGNYNDFDEPLLSSIPKEFICPLTRHLFEEPVTLETGQTFERSAITEWFGKGNRTCPATGKLLEFLSVPLTNFILKCIIESWKSEHCRHLLDFASQVAGSSGEHIKFREESDVFILEQHLTALGKEERIKNDKQITSLGSLEFLIGRFQCGNLEEKTCVAALLSFCIEADSGCRNQIARNIDKLCLIDLLHSKQAKSRTNAVLLLTELICQTRRKDVNYFLSGLQNEGIMNTMHILLVYLQSCPPEYRPLVAVLLLHLDLLVEPQNYSIFREEAVDALTVALESSLSDEKVQEKCCRALLILGGHFSLSGKLMTEDWILKQAGYLDGRESDALDNEDGDVRADEKTIADDEEEEAREEWLTNFSVSLLADGKKSFLETLSKCLGSGNVDVVGVCLTTVAWLSSALVSFSDAEFQLSAFSALFSRLKESLENGQRIEHKILASVSLLNFSKIPECRVLLMTIAEEIAVPIRSVAEVTWTAKELYAIIYGEHI